MIKNIKLTNFTAFKKLELECSPGINILIGENGTGKTQLLKAGYCLWPDNKESNNTNLSFLNKLDETFRPHTKFGNYSNVTGESTNLTASIIDGKNIDFTISPVKENTAYSVSGHIPSDFYQLANSEATFIPAKEVLSFYQGFVSLYEKREIAFDLTYRNLCSALALPAKKKLSDSSTGLLEKIKKICGGEFVLEGDSFVLKSDIKTLAVDMTAEGFRKLGTIQILLKNGVIEPGISGPLFWDEPESNINPKLLKLVAQTLLELQRHGLQIFIATHNYVMLKEIELLTKENDKVIYHALYRQKDDNKIILKSTEHYWDIAPNAISDTFADLYDRDLKRAMGDDND